MVYIGLSRYTDETIKKVINIKPTGVVLGDILCLKRMFPYSGLEVTEYLNDFKQHNIKVIFQTPMYATDRIFEKIIVELEYYNSKELVDGVIVQDVGVASKLREVCPNLDIIWGRMGYARTPVINYSTLSFLISCGVSGYECKNINNMNVAKKMGTTPYLVYGWPTYNTINRECYYKFENDIFDDKCNCGCLKKDKMILGSDHDNAVTIDGCVLGFATEYLKENIEQYTDDTKFVIYGENIEKIQMLMQEVEVSL